MSSKSRLDRAFKNAVVVPFNDESRIILFSDCHRGDNSFADDFAKNKNIYFHALERYYDNGFVYCELGDGDELWENLFFKSIFEAHKNVYLLLQKFHLEQRLYMQWGNHDMVYKSPSYVEKTLSTYFDVKRGQDVELFKDIKYHEGLILQHTETKQKIFLTHASSRLVELYVLEMEPIFGSDFMETFKYHRYCRPYKSRKEL